MRHSLEAAGIVVRYGKARAVSGATVSAHSGEIRIVVGPNGAGKSSLLLSIYGSVPGGGSVQLDGRDVTSLPPLERARLGLVIVPQGRQFFPRLSVRENLVVMADLVGAPPDAVEHALDRFAILRERANSRAGVLSGGEQQMLVVARALMKQPKVLLLDEMMTGLAPLIVERLGEMLRQLATDGIAVLMAEPELGRVADLVDNGHVMIRGEISGEIPVAGGKLSDAYHAAMGIEEAVA